MIASHLTPKQASLKICCSRRLIIDHIHSGQLRAVDVSRVGSKRPRYRIPHEALETFLLSREVRSATTPKRRRKKQAEGVIQFF